MKASSAESVAAEFCALRSVIPVASISAPRLHQELACEMCSCIVALLFRQSPLLSNAEVKAAAILSNSSHFGSKLPDNWKKSIVTLGKVSSFCVVYLCFVRVDEILSSFFQISRRLDFFLQEQGHVVFGCSLSWSARLVLGLCSLFCLSFLQTDKKMRLRGFEYT